MLVILFGVGNYYQEQKKKLNDFQEIEIVAFADNNADLWGQKIDGIPVIAPAQIPGMVYEGVVIMSIYVCEIYRQLLELGIPEHCIIIWERFCAEAVWQEKKLSSKGGVLLISTVLGYNGGTLAAVYAGLSLKKMGIPVKLAAPGGEEKLIEELMDYEIDVVLWPALPYLFERDVKWIQQFDTVIVNTFQMAECAFAAGKIRPTLWWVHEPLKMYQPVMIKSLCCQGRNWPLGLEVYAVSRIAQDNFNTSFHLEKCKKTLTLGIPDKAVKAQRCQIKDGKIVFAEIGAVLPIKAQHQFLNAVKNMRNEALAAFWIIGKWNDYEYCKTVRELAGQIDTVKVWGEKTRKELDRLFPAIDVIVCTSQEETLSITIIEGMMYGKICITTQGTGIARFIQDGVNGFVIPVNDTQALTDRMDWIIQNWDKAQELGSEARKTYEKYFTMDIFAQNLKSALGEITQEKNRKQTEMEHME